MMLALVHGLPRWLWIVIAVVLVLLLRRWLRRGLMRHDQDNYPRRFQ
jgi:hypothetical protein